MVIDERRQKNVSKNSRFLARIFHKKAQTSCKSLIEERVGTI
jgi:hypothetical protein